MFENLGFGEILLILLVLLLIFGSSKLPQLGKGIGEGIREFKKSMQEITKTDEPKPEAHEAEKKA